MTRVVRDDPDHPDPGFAALYASLPEPPSLEPWLELCLAAAAPVLYLGVGAGRLAGPLARNRIKLVGVDAHPGMLAAAGERLPGTELIEAKIEDLALERRFDLVIAPSNILDTPARLAAAAKHLEDQGRLAFELMNPHWLRAGDKEGVRVLNGDERRVEIEVDYPGGYVQAATVELVWPEKIEAFLAGARLDLVRIWGSDDGDLDASPTFFVVAAAATTRWAASSPPPAT